MTAFRHLSLSRQFLVASFPILLVGMLAIGLMVAHEIERGVVNRLGAVTSLYVDSLVAPHLQYVLDADPLDAPHRAGLDALLTDTQLGQKIIAFNIWRPDGRIVYSTNPDVIGRTFPTGPGFATALRGDTYSKLIDRSEQEHGFADRDWPPRLIETYAPVHLTPLGSVVGVAELYQTTDELARETAAAQRRSWLVVAAATSLMYLLLFGLVRRGSETIVRQRRELDARVAELSTLLERNALLDARVRGAAARTTSLNERFLRRISTDLHDGPGQDVGFALMRLDAIAERARAAPGDLATPGALEADFTAVRTGLDSALADLRSISAGLQLPDIERLSAQEVAERAIRDYERKTGAKVAFTARGTAGEAALPVKITLYRLLQEALANGFRHAGGVDQRVALEQDERELSVEIGDGGPGFDPLRTTDTGRVGLAGMRERVRSLGGSFALRTAAADGTLIRVTLPRTVPEADDE